VTKVEITKNHPLDLDAIRAAAHDALVRMRASLGLDGSWHGDVYEFSKPTTGKITIAIGFVRVELALGSEVQVAKGTVEKRIRGALERLLGR